MAVPLTEPSLSAVTELLTRNATTYSVQDGIGESRDDEKDNDQQPQSNFAVCVRVYVYVLQ